VTPHATLPDATLTLLPGRDRSVKLGHPWIFSGAVGSVERPSKPGGTVVIRDSAGSPLGHAAYSPASQIRARMWTFDGDTKVDADLVAARIHAAASRRNVADTDSTRVVFSEADGVPGLIADRYGDTIVCQLSSAGAEAWRETIADALFELPGVRSVYERSDTDARQREALTQRTGLMRGEPPDPDLVANEFGYRYAVNVSGGQKTGFYLDQRNARRLLPLHAAGRRVLNVCSYTGAFSVIAAANGASAITNIDSSGPALAAMQRNAELNGVDTGEHIEADAFTELRRQRDRANQYDLILLDPPKLATAGKQISKASRAYKDLNLLAIKLLAPGGVLMTWSCSGAMSAEMFQKVVAGAALDAGRTVRIVDHLHQPADHPVPLHFPEANYLKGFVLLAE
jgi:23S rRNA (cytosine1962-C5)-methyltransferase